MSRKPSPIIAAFLLTSAAFLFGCDSESEPSQAQARPATTEETVRQVMESEGEATQPEAVASGDVDPTIMDRPMDGSSTEAFEAGLKAVHASAPTGQAQRLDTAIKTLKVFDLSVRNDTARLYAKLDGKTPNEIIAQAKQR